MTVPPLVQTLPYVAWILLATLAFGGFAFVVITRQLSDATTGYIRFVAATSAVLALLTLLSTGGLSATDALAINPGTSQDASLISLVLIVFIVLAIAYMLDIHLGFSFSAEVMARIARSGDKFTVTIHARIRVVATVQVAYFFEDDVDFETEFEQDLPLAAVALAVGVNPLALQAAGAVL